MTPANAMTVDVEDWFQVQNLAGLVPRAAWDTLDRRVETRTDEILALFAAAGIRATFFTLGWVAERHPALLRRIVAAGHELASHGHGHELVRAIGPARFRADLRRAKATLEDATGVAVTGYRAPTFSIGAASTPWAHAILAEEGHLYSSSIFPGHRTDPADPAPPLTPWRPHADGVVELPMTTLRVPGRTLPFSGGGWFRLMPQAVFAAGLARANRQGRRGIFYFHPWEIDPGQPRVADLSRAARFKCYIGLSAMAGRVAALLRDPRFTWGRIDQVFAAELAPGALSLRAAA
jgi:polysaccharide deacetylase family protein (PEP-CTERM system associated)